MCRPDLTQHKVAERMAAAENASAMREQVIAQFHQLTGDPTLLSVAVGFCVFFAVFSLLLFFSGSSRNKTTGRKLAPVPRPFEGTKVRRTQATLVDTDVQNQT